jgi:hypothetical protein
VLLTVAREHPGLWDSSGQVSSPSGPSTAATTSASGPSLSGISASGLSSTGRLHVALSTAVDDLVSVRVDELSDAEVEAELEVVEVARRRLEARVSRLAGSLTHRRARRARQAEPSDRRAGERAARQARRELADALNWTPAQAADATGDGDRMAFLPRASSAADRGELSTRHLRVLSEVLDQLPNTRRDALEAELVEAGKSQDVREFARTCRRRLAEIDHDAAMGDLDRRHARRRASVFQGDDGMVVVSGRWAGVDGEAVLSAVNAFRRPDRPGEHRTSAQRTADAVIDAFAAALRAGEAPAEHGVRPQVMITIDEARLRDHNGAGEAAWSGPLPLGELKRVLDDCGLGWIVRDQGGLPLQAGPKVRTVPAGLRRALVDRDRGCIREGCDAPAAWCDVMHLGRRFAQGGRLSLDTAALGCRGHHRAYDRGHLQLHWHNRRPILRPPTRTGPPAERGRPRDGPDP